MSLNLTNVKNQANQIEIDKRLSERNEQKASEGRKRHVADIKELIKNLFAGEHIQSVNGGNAIEVIFGQIKFTTHIVSSLQPSHTSGLEEELKFRFTKSVDGKFVANVEFVDATDYLNLPSDTKEYAYTATIDNKNKSFKFSDVENLIQYTLDA
ncbi:hypothetical protein [Acinetobacter sp. SEK570]|uniref:hypothetical protein n=1 Tax=unclassified Acinetobacter TaxID=196816 RepID=UPI0039A3B5F8